MADYVDLHCHWVWQIDDGARSQDEGIEMLRRLKNIGFSHVVATPHMRPGMFDNQALGIREAFLRTETARSQTSGLPDTSLGSEHFFDPDVLSKIVEGRGLPYDETPVSLVGTRTGGAILIEFVDLMPIKTIEHQLFQLQTAGFIPVIAHPERYPAVWKDPEIVARLVDLGSVALLDIAALVGKYGRRSMTAAIKLLENGVYDAACTDSHRPADVDLAKEGIDWIESKYGPEEVQLLLSEVPRQLLKGRRPSR